MFKEFHDNGQVDVFSKKGKRSGAFCSYYTKKTPVYVFLNHSDNLNNVLTLAHEFGHAFHFVLSKENQDELNNDFPMATAETASTFFEDFVLEEVLQDATEEEQLSIMTKKLNDDISTIIRQVACYNFEKDIHNEFRSIGYVSKERFGELFSKNMSAYMGSSVEKSDGSQNWWVYWSHIRQYFYVYSYAFGLLASKALQKEVKKDPKNIEKMKTFLSAGSSKSPKDLFKDLGINVSSAKVWNDGLDEVEELLNRTEKLAKKLGY
ncbi:MAG: M3 family metallopeptidase [Candidatus Dojkabacteria bacterium]|nr:M3 family metallopeptidase [Candidatus Dojkabacteria bacterium]